MLIPYFVLYRLSSCFNLVQGNRGHLSEQYFFPVWARCSQFLILHVVRHLDFWLS